MPNKLAGFRGLYKISQSKVAKVIEKATPTYCNKENGKADFTRAEMIAITNFFKQFDPDVKVEELFF